MADKSTTTYELKLIAAFADEDDRTIRYPNPRDDLTKADILALQTLAIPVLIGDKYGATFTRFKSAKIVDKTETTLDLTPTP